LNESKSNRFQIRFLGAARQVTGSMHLVQCGGRQVLLDCGLYQGKRSAAYDINHHLPFDPGRIDAVLLSHAHIDHSGNLPTLLRRGFRGKIYATSATRDLAATMLMDSARIQESDVRYVNKIRRSNNEPEFHPLYTQRDAVQTIKAFRVKEYQEPFEVVPGLTVAFFDAGHMLGSVATQLRWQPSDCTLVYSGDLGRYQHPMLRSPEVVPDANYVIMEATYGNRLHNDDQDAQEQLRRVCDRVWQEKGRLLIPAFSVGRTQHIVYLLNQLSEAGQLPPFKVFVDSPMAIDATEVYRQHVECFNEDFIQSMLEQDDRDPLGFRGLYYVRHAEHSKKINSMKEPLIIISASGMLEGGRILHHLAQNIDNPNLTLLFAGFQAQNTLGRRILEGAKSVKIFGREYSVGCQTASLDSLSGHADQTELLRWISQVAAAGDLRQVALTHCEWEPGKALAEKIQAAGLAQVMIPEREDTIDLE